MSALKIAAITLIAAGVLALVYGSITYVSEVHDVDLGVVNATWKDKDTVHIPVWAGVAGIAAGAVMLFARKPA
jgi:predicted membrane channel-forming protein YqfA (hemolysin III family)